jgi:hypothetical protein
MHSRAVNPSVVELKQRADRDGIVKCFVRPTRSLGLIDVVLRDRRGILTGPREQRKQRPPVFSNRSRCVIGQDRLDEVSIAKELGRNCGVRAGSEQAVISSRCESRDQFPQSRRQGTRPTHHPLREVH